MVCLSLLSRAKHHIEAIHIDYGQAAAGPERISAEAIAKVFSVQLQVLTVDLGRSYGAGEIPYRNAALIFAAAMAAADRIDELAIGVHAGVPYRDCSENFLEAIRSAVRTSVQNPFGLVAPIRTWLKDEIIAYAVKENLPLHQTYSCEAGTIPPCGDCLSCQDRSELSC